MSKPIRICDELYDDAKKISHAERRSIPGQIEFWAMIGRCAMDNPDLPIGFVKDILIAKRIDRSLYEPFEFEEMNEKHQG